LWVCAKLDKWQLRKGECPKYVVILITKQNLLNNNFKIAVIYIKIFIHKEIIRERETETEKKKV